MTVRGCSTSCEESIEECLMLQPSQSYSRARKILKDLYVRTFTLLAH